MVAYKQMVRGRFLRRPNRFLAYVEIDGSEVLCHVKNTGRCRELLLPGTRVYCQHHDNPSRKTEYSLIMVQKGQRLICMDSQAPNEAAFQFVKQGGLGSIPGELRREVTHGDSRFDLAFVLNGQPSFMEVKGVTLEQDGVARFPDAPTQRGTKHLRGLQQAAAAGYGAYVLFVIQMKPIDSFVPNFQQDPVFCRALQEAAAGGVRVLAVCCDVTVSSMEIAHPVPVLLENILELQ